MAEMKDELRPCPFCGGVPQKDIEPTKISARHYAYPYRISCKCGGNASLDKWQSRPIESALQSELDTLKQSVKEAGEEIEIFIKRYDNLSGDIAWSAEHCLELFRSHGLIGKE